MVKTKTEESLGEALSDLGLLLQVCETAATLGLSLEHQDLEPPIDMNCEAVCWLTQKGGKQQEVFNETFRSPLVLVGAVLPSFRRFIGKLFGMPAINIQFLPGAQISYRIFQATISHSTHVDCVLSACDTGPTLNK